MKVIKTGQIPREYFKGTCGNCKSVVEAEKNEFNDIKYADNYDCRDPREQSYYYVNATCPVCNELFTLILKKELIPYLPSPAKPHIGAGY